MRLIVILADRMKLVELDGGVESVIELDSACVKNIKAALNVAKPRKLKTPRAAKPAKDAKPDRGGEG